MRTGKHKGLAFFTYLGIGSIILLSGCINPGNNSSTTPPAAIGYVYFDGHPVSGATIEGISADCTDHRSASTDDRGTYVLNITPGKTYNITATYQGLRHTVWPVYLDNRTDMYNISLTTTPRSTIEGSWSANLKGKPFPIDHMNTPVIQLVAWTKNQTDLSVEASRDGRFLIVVEPDVQYWMTSNIGAMFYYHNDPFRLYDSNHNSNITISPNETALIDIEFILP